jgi:shikimate kinase
MNKIVITGFMGSGKSSVARALAQLLSYEVIDLDDFIKAEQGRSAREIIEAHGELRFRELEEQALSNLMRGSQRQIVALGGGAWMSETNRRLITKQGATSIWLDAAFSLCWNRIAADAELRPLARNEAAAFKLFRERIALYELADLRVVVHEEESAEEIAAQIVQNLKERSGVS